MRAFPYAYVATALALMALAQPGCHSEQDPFEDLLDGMTTTGAATPGGPGGGAKTSTPSSSPGMPSSPGTPSATGSADTGSGSPDESGQGPKDDCEDLPQRYIVMGDGIPEAKAGLDGPDDPQNAFKMMHATLLEHPAISQLSYENVAKGGTSSKDVPAEQLDLVETGKPGHVLVNIHVGGNDLAGFILKSDKAAQEAFDTTMAEIVASWQEVFAFFEDRQKFPDGATFIVNTQYNPFDDCTENHGLFSVSETKIALMQQFNQRLRDLANAKSNAVIADQYRVFLGHGHHHDNDRCPHYKPGAEYWLVGGADLIHTNEKGHAAMAAVFADNAKALYEGCKGTP